MKNKILFLLRVSLGGLFVYASYHKILSPGAFAHEIYNYKMIPPWAINPMALTLPWIELICGVCLIFNKASKAASALILLMMSAFTIALLTALLRGLNISCGCFKSGGSSATWLTFGRDLIFLSMAVIQAVVSWKGNRGDN